MPLLGKKKKVKFFTASDLLRIATKFSISSNEDFAFLCYAWLLLNKQLVEWWTIEYQLLIRDPLLRKNEPYTYGLRILLSSQDDAVVRWRKKNPKTVEVLWDWNMTEQKEDFLNDMAAMRDMFAKISDLLP